MKAQKSKQTVKKQFIPTRTDVQTIQLTLHKDTMAAVKEKAEYQGVPSHDWIVGAVLWAIGIHEESRRGHHSNGHPDSIYDLDGKFKKAWQFRYDEQFRQAAHSAGISVKEMHRRISADLRREHREREKARKSAGATKA